MSRNKQILFIIEQLRRLLLEVVEEKGNFNDTQVVQISQILDSMLDYYHDML